MSKKSDRDETKDDEKDLEEEEEGGEETDEEEEQERVAAAKAQPRARASRPRREAHDDHGHGHGHEEEEAGDEDEDPYWWGPHAVMSVIILVGILGFFGALNKPLAFLPNVFDRALGSFVPKGTPHKDTGHAAAARDDKHAEPAKPTPPGPQPMRPGAEQGTREMFGAKHLLVMYKGSRRAPPTVSRTKEEALARATEASKKAKADKNKFADFVKEYSDEPGAATRGGDLGRFPKGQMVPEFQNALEKLKVGDVSDVVESPFGYHVILRTQ